MVSENLPSYSIRSAEPWRYGTSCHDTAAIHPLSRGYHQLKRVGDVLLSVLAISLLSPIFVLIYIALWLEKGGPVIVRHVKCGQFGKAIEIFKFRCAEPIPVSTETDNPNGDSKATSQAGNGDVKLTPVGRMIRQWSLEDLPQLFNVLRGEMALIGPRLMPFEVLDFMNDSHWARLTVKQGLISYKEAPGRHQLSLDERLISDLEYIETMSLATDAKILFSACKAILT